MKQIYKNLIAAFSILIGICLAWQAMHQFYKFDHADYISASMSLLISFAAILQALNILSIKDPKEKDEADQN